MDVKLILKSHTTKVGDHVPSCFLCLEYYHFKTENKHEVYRGEDCIKKFCESSREHVMKITNLKKKEIKLLTNEQQEAFEKAKISYICREKFEDKHVKIKNIVKLEIIVIIQVNIEVLHIIYVIQTIAYLNKLPLFFTMDLTMIFNYHFIMKELVEEFESQFNCLGGILKNT